MKLLKNAYLSIPAFEYVLLFLLILIKEEVVRLACNFLGSVFNPHLNNGIKLAILRLSGKVDNFIGKFMISQIGFVSTSAPSFKNLGDISSIPGTLETSRQLIY